KKIKICLVNEGQSFYLFVRFFALNYQKNPTLFIFVCKNLRGFDVIKKKFLIFGAIVKRCYR
ncbi:TPA: hypothetical protein ACOZPO_000118, partial [Enterococcus faecium]